MTATKMMECDFCEAVAKEMNEGVLRLTDMTHEKRFHMCEDCTEQHLQHIPDSNRRGRVRATA